MSLNYILDAEPEEEYQKVKVAVLDTGVDKKKDVAAFLADYKDLVTRNDKEKCDKTGHGTTSVSLIYDICESAEVYAIRIFENDRASHNTKALAIEVFSEPSLFVSFFCSPR